MKWGNGEAIILLAGQLGTVPQQGWAAIGLQNVLGTTSRLLALLFLAARDGGWLGPHGLGARALRLQQRTVLSTQVARHGATVVQLDLTGRRGSALRCMCSGAGCQQRQGEGSASGGQGAPLPPAHLGRIEGGLAEVQLLCGRRSGRLQLAIRGIKPRHQCVHFCRAVGLQAQQAACVWWAVMPQFGSPQAECTSLASSTAIMQQSSAAGAPAWR